MKRLFFLISAALLACGANALILETVELKDGTIMKGYTAGVDKNGNTIFMAEKISKTIASVDLYSQEADGHGNTIVVTKDGKYTVKTSEIQEVDGKFSFFVNTADSTARQVIDSQNPIKAYKRDAPDASQLSGLLDKVVSMEQGREAAVGIVTTQMPGNYWEVTTLDGKKVRYPSSAVDILEKVPISDYKFFSEQSPLIDTYVMKDRSSVTGFLKRKDWTSEEITIVTEKGEEKVLSNANIVEFSSKPNEQYKPVFDQDIEFSNVLVNNITFPLEEVIIDGQSMKVPIHDIELNSENGDLRIAVNKLDDGLLLSRIKDEFVEKKGLLDFIKKGSVKTADIPLTELESISPRDKMTTPKTSTCIYENLDCGYYLLQKDVSRVDKEKRVFIKKAKVVLFKLVGCN